MIKLVAFDLDGTLTQHRTKLEKTNRKVLEELSKKYKLLMVGAGNCNRIFTQMNSFPIDIIGNYGLQEARYNKETKNIDIIRTEHITCDKDSVNKRAMFLREKYGYMEFAGDSVEFHESGCITFAILGTKAKIEDKLAFDPDRSKRRKIYKEVCEMFPEYTVFVGGSSSFDMAPKPFDKRYALESYCKEHGIKVNEVCYVGDDYGPGGNDESVYNSDFKFITVDNYLNLRESLKELL